jgi:Excalibur calcium-binding domain
MARDSFLKTAAPLVAVTAIGVYNLPPITQQEKAAAADKAGTAQQVERSVYYSGCNEVRAAGKAPLYRGDPGFCDGMDGDHDGIACEPYY